MGFGSQQDPKSNLDLWVAPEDCLLTLAVASVLRYRPQAGTAVLFETRARWLGKQCCALALLRGPVSVPWL